MSDDLKLTRSAAVAAQRPKQRSARTVGGVRLGQEAGREARRLAAAILEVLAGLRTPLSAAQALGVSLPSYYHVESRALTGLLRACEPRPKRRQVRPDHELARLRKDNDRLQREVQRQQSLVRMAQRSIGLPPPPPLPAKGHGKKGRRRRPVARALQVAARLREEELPATPDSLQQAASS